MADTDDTMPTRYFKLDTRDKSFQATTYYAAWRPAAALVAVLFLIEEGRARVMFTIPLKNGESLRTKVQIGPDGHNGGIADVVGFEELPSRPAFDDVDFSLITDRSDALSATQLGTILEV